MMCNSPDDLMIIPWILAEEIPYSSAEDALTVNADSSLHPFEGMIGWLIAYRDCVLNLMIQHIFLFLVLKKKHW